MDLIGDADSDPHAFAVQVSARCLESKALIDATGSNLLVFNVEYHPMDPGVTDAVEYVTAADLGQSSSSMIGMRENGTQSGDVIA
jgi:hypothetical protein